MPAPCANTRDLAFAKTFLSNQIKQANKQGLKTASYQQALRNIEQDINARKHCSELVLKLETLSKELNKTMEAAERPPEGTKFHAGIQIGFPGKMPKEGPALATYLSTKVSAETPLVVKGMWVTGSAVKTALQTGDQILAIDGAAVDGLTIQQAIDKLLGSKNSKVRIGFKSGAESSEAKSGQPRVIEILRTTNMQLQPL